MTNLPFLDAKYIKAEKTPLDFSLYDPIPLFRKEFEINEDIKTAKIYVQSPGFATYYLNGKNITKDIFIAI